MFVGPNTDPAFLLKLHAGGEGLFPLAVQPARDHLRIDAGSPDLQVNDHPIFRALIDEGGKNRPLTRTIRIDRYLGVDPEWHAEENPETTILATLRGVEPLVVSRRLGEGRVVAFLTTASPEWNNWAMGPSYPVVILQLHSFLSSSHQSYRSGVTGEAIELQLDTMEFQPEVEFAMPTNMGSQPLTMKLQVDESGRGSTLASFVIGREGQTDARTGHTDRSGVYVARLRTLDGLRKQKRFVLNVPTSDSDLAIIESRQLAEQLEELGVELHDADQLEYQASDRDGVAWSHVLAGLLVVLLLGEQLFAYSASYHPKGTGPQ